MTDALGEDGCEEIVYVVKFLRSNLVILGRDQCGERIGQHIVDVFNEFVDYYAPFSERTNAWMSKLKIEDLCKIALAIKAEMPNATFGYNDWNFENPDKRKIIFEVI